MTVEMMNPSIDFSQEAEAQRDALIALRRDFHQHPETAFGEIRTASIVAQTLNALGMEVQTGVGKTGVIGILEGAYEGMTVLVRADMDALPIQEENAVDYVSQTPGKMHACGHDGHTAIALSVARLFAQHRESIHGRIKFVFQPAEEIAGGARAMIADGALENPRPDVSLGLHLWNSLPYGTLGVADGATMAGATIFSVQITGKGGHAASPHLGIDPVVCASHLVQAFQSVVSRNVDPFDTAVISTTVVRAGEAHNVIPQTAEMKGTVRTFRREVRDLVVARMTEIVTHICEGMGCTGEISFDHLTNPVFNDAAVGARLRPIFERTPGVQHLDMTTRTMGSEDVSLFMDDIPGMYFFVGAADTTADAYYGHHHPRFSFDERALPLGMALLAAAVGAYVLPEA